jgi:histidine triad (HIT) family protein
MATTKSRQLNNSFAPPPANRDLPHIPSARLALAFSVRFSLGMDTQSRDHGTTDPGQHTHCTFCDLIRGSAEVSICYEDSDAMAFMDIQPVNDGHVLVVPREHYESLLDVPQEIGVHLFQITMRLARAVRAVTGCEAMNIVVNSGKAAGQDEPHYHVHIIPRREEDGFDIPLPFNGSSMPERTLLDAYAVRIGSALRDPMRADAPPSSAARTAAPGSNVKRSETPAHAERVVAVPTYRESTDDAESASGPERQREPLVRSTRDSTRWDIREGAHGELMRNIANDTGPT